MMKLLLSFLLLCCTCSAQNNKDSLLRLLPSAKEDTAKVLLLINLSKATQNSNIEEAQQYVSKALALAVKLNYQEGRFNALIADLSITRLAGMDSLALEKCKSFVSLAEQLKDSFYIAAGYLNLGEVFDNNGDNEQAVAYCLKGLTLAERLNKKTLLQDAYSALQRIYLGRSEFDKAVIYGQKAIQLAKELNDRKKLITVSHNLAYTYNLTKEFDKSAALSEEIIQIAKEIGEQRVQTYALYNLCAIHLRTGNIKKAVDYGMQCLDLAKKLTDRSIESSVLAALSSCYLQLKQYKEAEKYGLQALDLRTRTEDKIGIAEVRDILANVYFALGEPEKGYALEMESEDFMDAYHESILAKQSSDLEKKYETGKKEDQIKLQQSQLRQQSLQNKFLIAGAAALLVILLLSFRNYRHRRRLQQAKIDELETEKQLTATEAVLKGEEQERTRLAKDLHDGLGGMLSGIKFSLSDIRENLVMTADNARAFERSIDMLDSSINEMRRVAHNMMPEVLVKYGLDTALKEFCDVVDRSGVMRVTYQSIGMQNTDIEQIVAVTLYRVVQELVNNAIKHSGGQHLLVQAHKSEQENMLAITVEDDGKGFDKMWMEQADGIGWKNIRNRVEFLKGTIDVQTSPGNGTSVMIEITL